MAKHIKINKYLLLCLLLLIFTLFHGCNSKKGYDITFSVGGAPAELQFWQQIVKQFESSSGIKVELLRQPTDTDLRRQGLITSLRSSRADPDVFLMDVAWLGQFINSHWIQPLDSYLESEDVELSVFFKKVIELSDKQDGNVYALPVYIDGGVLYYRKDLLEKYGFDNPPQTWAQLVSQSLAVQQMVRKTDPDFYGFVWQGAQYEGLVCNWLEYIASNGSKFIVKNDQVAIDTKANIQATQFMYDLIYKHKISPLNTFTEMKEEQVRMFFQQGNALFERNWPYAWSLHQSESSPVKDKVGITSLPHFDNGQSVSVLGGWHIGISRHSDAKAKSFKFVKFITSYDVQKQLALKLGWNPGRKDVYTDTEVTRQLPHFVSLRKVFENLYPRPNLPYYTLVSEIIQRNINAVLSKNSSPKQALTRSHKEIKDLIEQYEQK